jgi:lipase
MSSGIVTAHLHLALLVDHGNSRPGTIRGMVPFEPVRGDTRFARAASSQTGAVLHHQTFGAESGSGGPAAIALHGVRGHSARWRRLAEHHTTGLRLVALDLRGSGQSTWLPPWNLEQHAADVLATMDALGLSTVDLIGHSFGGTIALAIANVAPDRIRRLVLLDPALDLDPGYVLQRATQEMTPPTYADAEQARQDRAAHWPDAAEPEAIDEEVTDHLVATEDGRYGWRYAASAVVTAFSEMTRTAPPPPSGIPTLLVVAERGTAVGKSYLEALQTRPDLDVTVTRMDSGHTVYIDRPGETGALVQDFLG